MPTSEPRPQAACTPHQTGRLAAAGEPAQSACALLGSSRSWQATMLPGRVTLDRLGWQHP